MNLLKDIKITVVSPAAAAAQTAITGSVLDMAGFDGVVFVALTGDVTSGSVLSLLAKGNTANSTSSPSPSTLATATYTAASASDSDSKVLAVDVYRPTQQYVFPSLTRTTQDAVIGGIVAIQYQSHTKPSLQDASVIASAFAVGT